VDQYTGSVYLGDVDPDFDDDWETLRGPPRPPEPEDLIGHIVYLFGGQEVSPRFPILHRKGDPDLFPHTWMITGGQVNIDRVQVLIGDEVVWEKDARYCLQTNDTMKMNLELRGLRELFDQIQAKT